MGDEAIPFDNITHLHLRVFFKTYLLSKNKPWCEKLKRDVFILTTCFKGLKSGGMHHDLKIALLVIVLSYGMWGFFGSVWVFDEHRPMDFYIKKGEVVRPLLNYNSDSTVWLKFLILRMEQTSINWMDWRFWNFSEFHIIV